MQSENVIEVGIAAVSMLDSASAEEVIVRHVAVAVAAAAVVAEHTHRRDKARNAVVECASDLRCPARLSVTWIRRSRWSRASVWRTQVDGLVW